MKTATAILTSDWHIRDDQPICRTDNFFEAQKEKIKFIKKLRKEHDCTILFAGDLFHKAKSSPFLESFAIRKIPTLNGIPGNHDLPSHQIAFVTNSSFGVMMAARKIMCSSDLPKLGEMDYRHAVGLIHTMVHKDEPIHPDIVSTKAITLLKQYPDLQLILTGDNHQSFVQEYEGRLLVNPGSLMRQTADQMDHKPRVYLWYSEDNTVEEVFIPIKKDVVNREHIEVIEARDRKIEIFVNKIKEDYDISLSFEQNLENFFVKNRTRESVENIVWESVENK